MLYESDIEFDEHGLPKIKPFYYKFKDFKYRTEPKERILSGIRELDFLTKGFELGCITLWTGLTNSRKDYRNDNDNKENH